MNNNKFLTNDPKSYKLNHTATKIADCIPEDICEDDKTAIHGLLTVCAELGNTKKGILIFIIGCVNNVELESTSQIAEFLLNNMADNELGGMVMGMVMQTIGDASDVEGMLSMLESMGDTEEPVKE